MKYISLAVLALIANVQAVKYAVSEGPTKADNGEADEDVLPRELDAKGKWTNPLSLSDEGDDDESVLAQLSAGKRHHKKHHHHNKQHAQRFSQQRRTTDRYRQARDAYDGDPTSTSPYDDMYQHKKFDYGVEEGKEGSKGPWGTYHGTWTSGVA